MKILDNVLSPAAFVLFLLGCSCAALSSFLTWQEIGEINRKLPASGQISIWGMHPRKMTMIRKEYCRLFPSGKIDLLRRIFQYAAFAFMALLLIPLRFFK